MPYRSPAMFEEKPYNRCIDCVHIGIRCDGPNFLAMDPNRIAEWARLRKDYLHRKDSKWTNEYIAKKSGYSYTTVGKFMAGRIEDLKVSTASAILCVLVNGTWGQYPCALASGEIDYDKECAYLREQLSAEQRKTEFLKDQIASKDRVITALIDKK